MKVYFDWEFLEDGHTIEPISLGMIREDGQEYYAELELGSALITRITQHEWLMANVWPHLTGDWKPRVQVAEEVRQFVGSKPEFWAYCSAYDWVCLNQLYGSMVDHPNNWPFYCNDLAQYAESNGVHRRTQLPIIEGNQHNALDDARWCKAAVDEVTRIRNVKIMALKST